MVREPAEHDRRVMVVHLTDKGRAMPEPIADLWQSLEGASAGTPTEEQAGAFVETAGAITDSISSRPLPQEESG